MDPPKSIAGQVLLGLAGLGLAGWTGAAINSRAVAQKSPAGATAAAAMGAVTGGMIALFGAAALSVTDSKWRRFGATTTVLGAGGFAALSLIGLRASDRLITGTVAQPRALLALQSDSGSTFALRVGDTLTAELPAPAAGYAWVWAPPSAAGMTGPAKEAPATGALVEHDTWTATAPGTVTLIAQLTPTAGGPAISAWTTTATIT